METKEKKDTKPSVAEQALKTANEAAAEVRKLRTQMEDEGVITNAHANMRGGDLYRAKKAAQSGSVRVAMLVVVLFAAVVIGADVLRDGWVSQTFGTFAVYGDDATGESTLVVDNVTGDLTGDVTAGTVSGAASTDEVLSMGYSTLTTDVTLTKGGSYFVTTGTDMTITLPDPSTVLGKSLRIVLAGDGGDLTVNGALTSHYYVAGDGGATDSSAVLDDALDMIEIQAISTVLWGVLDQTGVSSYTTR